MAVEINGLTGLTFNNGSLQDVGGVGTSGQTWQNVSGSRGFNTTYTNTTGKPIMVNIAATIINTTLIFAYVSNVQVSADAGTGATSNAPTTISFIVPNGANYLLSNSGFSAISVWAELR